MTNLVNLIDQQHKSREEPIRSHMGCSSLGHECNRYIWLNFRWAFKESFSGRMLRLFRRGHHEERFVVEDLRSVGIDVRDCLNNQKRVDLGCHVAGHPDGEIVRGMPEDPKGKYLLEVKTHNKASFSDVLKNGVRKAVPQHYAQMQLYMKGRELLKALYYAVCKNDDEVYTDIIEYDSEFTEKLLAKGQRLALDDRMPPPISKDPSFFICKMCSAHDFCHNTKTTTEVNCRTCAHSTAKDDSTWRCERHDADGIPAYFQAKGCDSHVLHPDLVPWEREESTDKWTAIYIVNNKQLANGDNSELNCFKSREILANAAACGSEDKELQKLRSQFPGSRIVG